eukprot:TRINITY_DN13100_c0_g1_i1.p1 TRINITY_DN13100_c0_g1~~TRINITY_DN13100_c0_g1_i1.p1  ORF type:complete len:234 (+),score=30.22 TRINITY_DN13100_c0_g1_i1:179-880(+)
MCIRDSYRDMSPPPPPTQPLPAGGVSTPTSSSQHPRHYVYPQHQPSGSRSYSNSQHPATSAADRASPIPSGLLAAGGGQQIYYSGGGDGASMTQSSPRYAAPTATSLEHSNLKYQVEYVLTRREELSQIQQYPAHGSEALEVAYGGGVNVTAASPRSQSHSRHHHNHYPSGGEHNTSLEIARGVAQQLTERFGRGGGGSPSRRVSSSSMSHAPSPPTTYRKCEDGLCNTLGLR